MNLLSLLLIILALMVAVWLFRLLEGVLLPLVAVVIAVFVLLDLSQGGTVMRGLLDQFAQFITNLILSLNIHL